MLKLRMVLIGKWIREWYSARFIEHVYNLPSFREQSCNWNECIPGEISNRVLTRPIYYNRRPTGFSEWMVNNPGVVKSRYVGVYVAHLLYRKDSLTPFWQIQFIGEKFLYHRFIPLTVWQSSSMSLWFFSLSGCVGCYEMKYGIKIN